ncbi:hypothetical protein NHP190012_10240 [Helicobacter sp. NHP19-012]|uniref:Uncharacterized protein n=1 Tax=Helicobacter gastrofelis TaxID=2849642 RepID=A0ABN6I734_9HELI|nr:hypothetical protein NHP190012_10240 [Helicobacter sp. NHP19-012]
MIHIPPRKPQRKDYENPIKPNPLWTSGTGKTHYTIDKALEILGHDTKKMERAEAKALFDSYKQKGRIGFVTFHQSYGYEEFVEGIKRRWITRGR